MSDIKSHRYWRVSEPALTVVDEARARRVAFHEHCMAMARKYGADMSDDYFVFVSADRLTGLKFEGDPGKHWKRIKQHPGFWSPKRNGTRGKEIAADLDSVHDLHMGQLTMDLLGTRGGIIATPHGHVWPTVAIEVLGDTTVASMRVDKDWNLKPVEGLEQIRVSEYAALVEEHGQEEDE